MGKATVWLVSSLAYDSTAAHGGGAGSPAHQGSDPPCSTSYTADAVDIGATLDAKTGDGDTLCILVSPLTRALMTYQASMEHAAGEVAAGVPDRLCEWVSRATNEEFAPELADFHPRQSRFDPKSQLQRNRGRTLGRLRADPLTAAPARRLQNGRAVQRPWWNTSAEARWCVARASARVLGAAERFQAVVAFTHSSVAVSLLRLWGGGNITRLHPGDVVECQLDVIDGAIAHAAFAVVASLQNPRAPPLSPLHLSRSPSPAAAGEEPRAHTPPQLAGVSTPASRAHSPASRSVVRAGESTAAALSGPRAAALREGQSPPPPRRPVGAPSGIDIVQAMRRALSHGISSQDEVRELEAFMPPVVTRLHCIVVFMEEALTTHEGPHSGKRPTRGSSAEARSPESSSPGRGRAPRLWPVEDADGVGADARLACAAGAYATLLKQRIAAQWNWRSVEDAWNKGVALAVRRVRGGRWRHGFSARDEYALTLVREDVRICVVLVGRESQGAPPGAVSPLWEAWNRWVAVHELPGEDVAVAELPHTAGRGRLVSAAVAHLEELRTSVQCDVDDASVAIVASPRECPLVRLAVETRWPEAWAASVVAFTAASRSCSTAAGPRSPSPSPSRLSTAGSPGGPATPSPGPRSTPPPSLRRRSEAQACVASAPSSPPPSVQGLNASPASPGPATSPSSRTLCGAAADAAAPDSLLAELPSREGALFFAAFRKAKGRPCTIHTAAQYGSIAALLDLLLPHRCHVVARHSGGADADSGEDRTLWGPGSEALLREARKLRQADKASAAKLAGAAIASPGPAPASAALPGIDREDCTGRTPLLHALESGHTACAGLLLTAGANPCAGRTRRGGANSLHLAAAGGRMDTLRMVLRAMDPTGRRELAREPAAAPQGQWTGERSPADVALAFGHERCAALLERIAHTDAC